MTKAGPNDSEKEAAVRALFQNLPADYKNRYAALQNLSHVFREQLAASLQPALNAHLREIPQETIAQRRDLAAFVNQTLRQIGLTLRCQRTGKPATLIVDLQDADHADISRFRFQIQDDRGKRTRTLTSRTLPDLELMEDPPRIESFARSFRAGRRDEPQR